MKEYLQTSFFHELQRWAPDTTHDRIESADKNTVARILEKAESGKHLLPEDYAVLLSPCAASFLEDMAQIAKKISLREFGRSMQLFTPLYLANYCTNHCLYCGFNKKNNICRSMLSFDEIEAEGRAIAATGLRHILLLTGDDPKRTGPEYIAEAVRRLRPFFPGIGIEVYALTCDEYKLLIDAGVDSLTMFQETYNATLYAELHPAGPKHDYRFRLEAPDRGACAGMRCIGVGALLGLDEWRRDAFYSGLHAYWLQKQYPAVDVSLSTPRMRPHEGIFDRVVPVSDRDLIQYIEAIRLFLPYAGITLSTRERPFLRDHLIELGITKISAGVSTAVGGHAVKVPVNSEKAADANSVAQFEISDTRSVDEMASAIRAKGYQPLFKYWEPLEGKTYACGQL